MTRAGRVAVATVLTVSATLLRCVPSAEEIAPHGAVAYRITPSAASAGAPIETMDGYSVQFARCEALTEIVVLTPNGFQSFEGRAEPHAFHVAESTDFVPAIPEGNVSASLGFSSAYADGLDAAIGAFSLPSEERVPRAGEYVPPTTLVLDLMASKGSRRIHVAIRLNPTTEPGSALSSVVNVTVTRDALTTVSVVAQCESLFRPRATDGLYFAAFDAADRNRDGELSAEEMRTYQVYRDELGDLPSFEPHVKAGSATLPVLLNLRAGARMFHPTP